MNMCTVNHVVISIFWLSLTLIFNLRPIFVFMSSPGLCSSEHMSNYHSFSLPVYSARR